MENIVTPIKVDRYAELLKVSGFDPDKAKYLVDGFTNGFDIGYRGPEIRQNYSENIPLHIGTKTEMWNKMMKEVKMKRYAGPYEHIPFDNFIQSPIGLVPKAGNQTRLIFHLSFNFSEDQKSVNHHTPKEFCTVKYRDLDFAISQCLNIMQAKHFTGEIFYSKSDLKSAFRILPLKIAQIRWLCMKCEDPKSKKVMYFIDKNLPFGSSVSCSQFQKFSDSLKHLSDYINGRFAVKNYLDDFLFISDRKEQCDQMVRNFLDLCDFVGCPVALEKTEWSTQQIVFLGILLDGQRKCLALPVEKVNKVRNLINQTLHKKGRKVTIKELQSLVGFLNFLNKAIVPGRAFTRRMYAKIPAIAYDAKKQEFNKKLKPYHHIKLDIEFVQDCKVWLWFLDNCQMTQICRPFVDLNQCITSTQLDFYTDASKAIFKGIGCVFEKSWNFSQWEPGYIEKFNPSIEYLELLALCIGIFSWQERICNTRVIIFCDNDSVKNMVNSTSSKCRNCMFLIRLLVLNNLKFNRRIWVKHVKSAENILADALSRLNFKKFWKFAPRNMDRTPTKLPEELWPASKLWQS